MLQNCARARRSWTLGYSVNVYSPETSFASFKPGMASCGRYGKRNLHDELSSDRHFRDRLLRQALSRRALSSLIQDICLEKLACFYGHILERNDSLTHLLLAGRNHRKRAKMNFRTLS